MMTNDSLTKTGAADIDTGSARRGSRALLLDTAEQLIAEHGIGGVSLREIAAAAGQKNNSAVHYYFKDKQGLVDALIADRIAKVEEARSAIVEEAGDLTRYDAGALLRMMWQPMLDLCTQRGGAWVIQFHLSYHLSSLQNRTQLHPITADPDHHQASSKLLQALRANYPQLHIEQLRYRLGLIFMMFWTAVSRHDLALKNADLAEQRHFSLDELVRMAIAALGAPPAG
ncbi:MAG: helix-turn-helix domain-containing protein [Sphingobium sp.]